jgi:hypothetical protein
MTEALLRLAKPPQQTLALIAVRSTSSAFSRALSRSLRRRMQAIDVFYSPKEVDLCML